uniref:Uncharacterized protein n=1 Tax=Panagrolaimus sp. JU765 TaxID=591449 RepID=A0AC34R9J9_9BILA
MNGFMYTQIINLTIINACSIQSPIQKKILHAQCADFLTVRGGGHFPASSAQKPRESLQMFYNFIKNQDYSKPIPS